MDRLEVHSLICKRDINLFIATIKLFHHHSKLDVLPYGIIYFDEEDEDDEDGDNNEDED